MYCVANGILLKILESKPDETYTWMLSAILKMFWRQQRNKSEFYRYVTDFFYSLTRTQNALSMTPLVSKT